ncbi:hypothetical protein FGO68_gene9369 [Halteria grandinella]|uniref:G domain-containing protein n=1 Tax=Halteria grandinella TaxID=5974 RepID=A0A8J8T1B1_HALGN|nr:hypothetical protein FGO68_gene9369 [Halteria grandinella]
MALCLSYQCLCLAQQTCQGIQCDFKRGGQYINYTKQFIFVVGSTQTGKSSLINTMAGQAVCRVGDGSYQSTTDEMEIKDAVTVNVNGLLLALQDTIGTEDTTERYDNQKIKELQEFQMMKEESNKCKFIITQSLAFPQVIKKTIAELEGQYGPQIRNSVIVVLTKENLVPKSQKNKRIESAIMECQDLEVQCIIVKTDWAEEQLNMYERQLQNSNIALALSKVQPFSAEIQQERLQMILAEAKEAQKNGPTQNVNCRRTEMSFFEYVEDALVPKLLPIILIVLFKDYEEFQQFLIREFLQTDKYIVCDKVPAYPIEYYLKLVKEKYIKKVKDSIFKRVS